MSMAMQSAISLSKIIMIAGAGYTTTLLCSNGKLSDVLGQLQDLVKGFERNHGDGDEYGDAIVGQVLRLAMEVQQLASARQITVLNGESSGNVTSLVVPATALGAIGYGYIRWKGLSFSDFMYVTKGNVANAVSNLKNNLESVSEAITATKRHLTKKVENLDKKMDEQVETTKSIINELKESSDDMSRLGYGISSVQGGLCRLDDKLMTLEEKQEMTNAALRFLCKKADERMIYQIAQEQVKLASSRYCGSAISSARMLPLEGIRLIVDSLEPGDVNNLSTNVFPKDYSFGSKNHSRMLTRRRTVSIMLESSGQ